MGDHLWVRTLYVDIPTSEYYGSDSNFILCEISDVNSIIYIDSPNEILNDSRIERYKVDIKILILPIHRIRNSEHHPQLQINLRII